MKQKQVPIWAKDRKENNPIVIAGGPCAYNSEPVAGFFDIIVMGEGEEVNIELNRLYIECKENGKTRKEFLHLGQIWKN